MLGGAAGWGGLSFPSLGCILGRAPFPEGCVLLPTGSQAEPWGTDGPGGATSQHLHRPSAAEGVAALEVTVQLQEQRRCQGCPQGWLGGRWAPELWPELCPSPFCLLSAAEPPAHTPQECFQRISRRLRATLKRGRIPMVSWGLGGGPGEGRAVAARAPHAGSSRAVSPALSPEPARGHRARQVPSFT